MNAAFRVFCVLQVVCALSMVLDATAKGSPDVPPVPEMVQVRKSANWPLIKSTAAKLLLKEPRDYYSRDCLIEADIQLGSYKDAESNLQKLGNQRGLDHKQYFLWALVKWLQHDVQAARKYAELMMTGPVGVNQRHLNEDILHAADKKAWQKAAAKARSFPNVTWYLSGGRQGDHSKAVSELKNIFYAPPDDMGSLPEFTYMTLSGVPQSKLTVDERIMMAEAVSVLQPQGKALDWLEPIATAKPKESLDIMHGFASAHFEEPARAVRLLKRLEPLNEKDPKFWSVKAIACWNDKQFDEALRSAKRAISLDPCEQNLWLFYNIQATAMATGGMKRDLQALLSALGAVVKKYPSVKSYAERAKLMHQAGLYESELENISGMISLLPPGKQQTQALVRKAKVEYLLGDLRASEQTVAGVLAKDPKNENCLNLQERLEYEMKRASMRK